MKSKDKIIYITGVDKAEEFSNFIEIIGFQDHIFNSALFDLEVVGDRNGLVTLSLPELKYQNDRLKSRLIKDLAPLIATKDDWINIVLSCGGAYHDKSTFFSLGKVLDINNKSFLRSLEYDSATFFQILSSVVNKTIKLFITSCYSGQSHENFHILPKNSILVTISDATKSFIMSDFFSKMTSNLYDTFSSLDIGHPIINSLKTLSLIRMRSASEIKISANNQTFTESELVKSGWQELKKGIPGKFLEMVAGIAKAFNYDQDVLTKWVKNILCTEDNISNIRTTSIYDISNSFTEDEIYKEYLRIVENTKKLYFNTENIEPMSQEQLAKLGEGDDINSDGEAESAVTATLLSWLKQGDILDESFLATLQPGLFIHDIIFCHILGNGIFEG